MTDEGHLDNVAQLLDAENYEKARRIVQSFLISERMAARLCDVVFPSLQLALPTAAKGVFVIGGFGRGKTHLISFISALAQYPDHSDGKTLAKLEAEGRKERRGLWDWRDQHRADADPPEARQD